MDGLKTCYFISGLGADASVFSRLELDPAIEVVHLPWFKPEANETIQQYAGRMAAKINEPETAALVGLSFGGVVAVEISKLIGLRQLILLNSIAHRGQMPLQLKAVAATQAHRLTPTSLLLANHQLAYHFFGARTQDQKALLSRLLETADHDVVTWSIDQLVNWKNEKAPDRFVHIHGSADVVFPLKNVKADFVVEDGPHFMVFTHPREVNTLLNQVLLNAQR